MNGRSAGGGDLCRRDALVDDRVVVPVDDVVDHGRVVEDLACLMVRHAVAGVLVMMKIVVGHKREAIPRQAEREARAARTTIVGEAHARRVTGRRRQRCPAAIRIRIAPAHPRRGPGRSRHPAPAPARVRIPPAIMERRPAPRIIRIPIPAAVGPFPAPAIAVGPPARRRRHRRRTPATAITIHVNPGAVGRQFIVEIIYGLRRRPFRLRRRRHGGGGGWLRGGRGFVRGLLPGVRGRRRLAGGPGGWGRRCGCGRAGTGRLAQLLIAVDHRGHHGGRHADVLQINNLFGFEAEGVA